MSFDLFLSSFREGALAPFPVTLVAETLGPVIARQKPECWGLAFPDGGMVIDRAIITHLPPELVEGLVREISEIRKCIEKS